MQGAEIRRAIAAGQVGHAHLDQRQAHQTDDGAGHYRGDHLAQLVDELAEGDLDEGGAEADAEQGGEDLFLAAAAALDDEPGAENHAEEAEAGALQAQQPRADRTDALGLDEGAKAGDEQRHAHQIGHMGAQAKHAADDQRRRDDTDEAGQHVLQGGEDGGSEGRGVVELVGQVAVARRRSWGVLGASRGHVRACQLFLCGHGLARGFTGPLSERRSKLSGRSE
ncbi:hypothetical protein D3C84_746340 [compost metagenome]